MEHLPTFTDQLDADYISHHGIKGMHWGIRRYQNPDGSLTSQGKTRYSLNPIKRLQQKHAEKVALKDQAKKDKIANNIEDMSKRYAKYSKEFSKAAQTIQKDGVTGKSIYMRRLNETDWSEVYDGGALHRKNLKDVVSILKDCSAQSVNYSKVYSDAAKYLRNSNSSYKDSINYLNNNIYKSARKKYGIDMVSDYAFIIDDNPDHWD